MTTNKQALSVDYEVHDFFECTDNGCEGREPHCGWSWCGRPRNHPAHSCYAAQKAPVKTGCAICGVFAENHLKPSDAEWEGDFHEYTAPEPSDAEIREQAKKDAETAWKARHDWFAACGEANKARRTAESEAAALHAQAKSDCEKVLITLAGAGICTPEETYGENVSWAISDLCRGMTSLKSQVEELRKALEVRDKAIENILAAASKTSWENWNHPGLNIPLWIEQAQRELEKGTAK